MLAFWWVNFGGNGIELVQKQSCDLRPARPYGYITLEYKVLFVLQNFPIWTQYFVFKKYSLLIEWFCNRSKKLVLESFMTTISGLKLWWNVLLWWQDCMRKKTFQNFPLHVRLHRGSHLGFYNARERKTKRNSSWTIQWSFNNKFYFDNHVFHILIIHIYILVLIVCIYSYKLYCFW
jgi:hypothetical protein